MRAHRRARSHALQTLYAWEARGAEPDELIRIFTELDEEVGADADTRLFAVVLLRLVARELPALNRIIQGHLANWRLERLAVVDRNLLRLGAAELLYVDDVPGRVTVRELVRLAERFGTPESPRFVNGVLDAIMRHAAPHKAQAGE